MSKIYQIAIERIQENQTHKQTSLDLSNIGLTTLPDEVIGLKHLKELYISNNHLSTLPHDLCQLSQLEVLEANNNALTLIPKGIRKLAHLKKLNLSNNKLNSLPKEIGYTNSLQWLYLDDNNLSSLPKAIRYLNKLEELSLCNNKIQQLPNSIKQLTHLKRLHLAHNQINKINPIIEELPQLAVLDVSHNQLSSLPKAIGQLSNLQTLLLNNNALTSLPVELIQLKKLDVLEVSHNHIGSLPKEYMQLTVRQLNITDNHFNVPIEVFNQKTNEIVRYILDLQASKKKKPLHEAKLIFIGSGYVGKTSLINMLSQGYYNTDELKTEGIQIKEWRIPRGRDTLKLNVWDFGGQEIMHATHKFFMTSRTAYILVINPRTEDKYGDSELEYWLKLIHSYATDVPIVVAINKCETHKADIPKGELTDKYPNIVSFVETSCKKNIGIGKLKKEIFKAVSQLKHIDTLLPQSYFEIKNKLTDRNDDYIQYTEYEHLCTEINPNFGAESMETLVGLLHDLGVMLNFNRDRRLKDTQVLNPEWVTSGVYQIITSPRLLKRKGILQAREISKILDKARYPSDRERFYIMDIMHRFELCYQVPHVRDTYFIPGAFPKDRPTIDWKYKPKDLLRFQYTYDVLPSSVMSRFIVKVHGFIRNRDYWRNGVILSKNHCVAFIKADPEERKIYIQVAGRGSKRELLGFIRSQFELIHQRLPKIQVENKIPVDDLGKIVLDYDDLLFYEEMGETSILVRSLRKRVEIRQLLNGISSEDERKRLRQLNNSSKRIVQPASFASTNLPNEQVEVNWGRYIGIMLTIIISLVTFLGGLAELTGVNLKDVVEYFFKSK